MNRIALPVIAALVVLLAACAATVPAPTPPPTATLPCNAEAASAAIGKAATADVIEQARIDSGATIARALRPGQVVTMEFRADRLNLDVNERNAVTGLRCG